MAYWIVKSEPSVYSFEQFQKDKTTVWDGVKNPAALINLRSMKKGDTVLFYHSNDGKCLVGTAVVNKEAYPDPKSKNPKLVVVELSVGKALAKPVTLAEIKSNTKLAQLELVRISRLSVSKVPDTLWKELMKMAGEK
ncbi:MAG TPA: EVE domain-containing protein [bacterium]|nr:EVE domain-containing protein [bacterium]HMW36965.1 EVE domain-containing protein [bacterium]HMY35707.1 EVE domain-containing protein [bacterium]HMZ04220.1 EVE domain-containing protein [bacterium]HNB09525.1 EVE domain-containing protein [bacterium]